jgi:hypothetical protein
MNKRDKKKLGRPATANLIRVAPEGNTDPNVHRVGRAFLALVLHHASKRAKANSDDDSGVCQGEQYDSAS